MSSMARIEDYALLGDLQTAALVSRAGSIDWCCFPRFDSGACFAALLGDTDHGRWLLAPAGEVRRSTRRLSPRHADSRSRCTRPTRAACARSTSCHRAAWRPTSCASSRASTVDVPMRSELVIRFDYGAIVPWVRRVDHARVAIAGPDALCLRTPLEIHGEEMTTVSEFTLRPGERIPFVLTWFPSHEPLPAEIDPEAGARRHRGLLARMGRRLRSRGRLPRGDPPVAPAAQGSDLRARRAASSRRRPRRCPSGSAACATGTTATAGCAMPP